jgi:hypothetical protein
VNRHLGTWNPRPAHEEDEMSSRAKTLKLGAILASTVVSSYALFGHDAWAPEPARLDGYLSGGTGVSAAAYYVNTLEQTTVLKWPGSWTAGSAQSGTPCSTYSLSPGATATQVIERHGNYARCTTWPTEGARLTEALGATGSTAPATTLVEGAEVTVVQFPATWTSDTTLEAGTYCTSWAAPAGTAVGTIIVRSGDYAKCSY